MEHALDAFYAEMILWKLGVGKEAQVLSYACLKFKEMLRRKCLGKLTTNISGNWIIHKGPQGEGIVLPLLATL